MSVEERFERRRTLQRQRTSDHRARKSAVPSKRRSACLDVVPLSNNMQQHAKDRRAAETVEVREERLFRRHGVQQQHERDRRATETEAQREGRLAR